MTNFMLAILLGIATFVAVSYINDEVDVDEECVDVGRMTICVEVQN